MKKIIILVSASLLFVMGCQMDNDLRESNMIFDSEYTDLPAYSEWGYNTFGAYYDREIFISNNLLVPAKVIVSNTETSFILYGQKGANQYYDYYSSSYNNNDMSLSFKLGGLKPVQYTDLTLLNDTIIDLKDPLNQVIVTIDTNEYLATILTGQLTFKKAQNLQVDKKQVEVILSGYFDCKALINNKPYTISNGRFDVGVSSDNFYDF